MSHKYWLRKALKRIGHCTLQFELSSYGICADRGNQRKVADSTAGQPDWVRNWERPFTFRELCLVGSPKQTSFLCVVVVQIWDSSCVLDFLVCKKSEERPGPSATGHIRKVGQSEFIPGVQKSRKTRTPTGLNFVLWPLIFVGPQTWHVTHRGPVLVLWRCAYISGKICIPWIVSLKIFEIS